MPMFRNRSRNRGLLVGELHIACQERPLPIEKIQQLVEERPEIVEMRGEDGWLPIHRVCRRQPSLQVLKCLIKTWPECVCHWTGDGVKELGARLPIHLACQHGASLEAVKYLARTALPTLETKCLNFGMTPLDYAHESFEEDQLEETKEVIAWLESMIPSFQRKSRRQAAEEQEERSNEDVGRSAHLPEESHTSFSLPNSPENNNQSSQSNQRFPPMNKLHLKPPPRASRGISSSTATTTTESQTDESTSNDPVSVRIRTGSSISTQDAESRAPGAKLDNAREHSSISLNSESLAESSNEGVAEEEQTTSERSLLPNVSPQNVRSNKTSVSFTYLNRPGPPTTSSSVDGGHAETVVSSTTSNSSRSASKTLSHRLGLFPKKKRAEKYCKQLQDACAENPPSLVLVKQTLGKCGLAAQARLDHTGFIPLHQALVSGASLEVVQALVEAWPESVQVATSAGYLPLHVCFTGTTPASLSVVQYLISRYPDAVSIPATVDGNLPIHCACMFGASTEVIYELVQQYSIGASEKNLEGFTPCGLAQRPSSVMPVNHDALRVLEIAATTQR